MEALEAVSVGSDRGAFAAIQMLPDFFRGMHAVIEIGDEGGDRALEVDVVLPESVISIEENGLARRFPIGDVLRSRGGRRAGGAVLDDAVGVNRGIGVEDV